MTLQKKIDINCSTAKLSHKMDLDGSVFLHKNGEILSHPSLFYDVVLLCNG